MCDLLTNYNTCPSSKTCNGKCCCSCLVSIIVGFIGAYIGTWLATALNLPPIFVLNIEGQPFPLVWAIIGAAIFAAILSALSGRRAYG